MLIQKDHWQEMLYQVDRSAPVEACGLLAGLEYRSLAVFPITNELQSPVQFRMAPQEQFDAFMEIERSGWDLLAIYHSHPAGSGQPSPTDQKEFAYPGTLYLIWYRQSTTWHCRAFDLSEGRNTEIEIQIF